MLGRGEHRSVGADEGEHVDRGLLHHVGVRVPGERRGAELEKRDGRPVEVAHLCSDVGGQLRSRRKSDTVGHERHRPPFARGERVTAVEDLPGRGQRLRRGVGRDLRVDDLPKRAVERARCSDAEDRPPDAAKELQRAAGIVARHRHVGWLHPDLRVVGPDLGGQEGHQLAVGPGGAHIEGQRSIGRRRLQDEVERNSARQPGVGRERLGLGRTSGVQRLDVEQRPELGRRRRRRLRAAAKRDQRREGNDTKGRPHGASISARAGSTQNVCPLLTKPVCRASWRRASTRRGNARRSAAPARAAASPTPSDRAGRRCTRRAARCRSGR